MSDPQLLYEIRKIREALEGINLRLRLFYEEGKYVAIVGVIALVIMSGIWGILQILRSSIFGV